MKDHSVIWTKNSTDERFTPDWAVKPIVEFIDPSWTVWCPFDEKDSEFVKILNKHCKVIHSHIRTGQDFFNYEPDEHYDAIISNPPFRNKRLFFERAFDLQKPFALIMTLTWLADRAPIKLFMERKAELQLLMFDQRMEFMNNVGQEGDKITFCCAYYCHRLLPSNIVLRQLEGKPSKSKKTK
ncbi:MAG: tRNA (adenine-N(6)-)-methyltransferase [Bacteroidetes bacterium]|nr:MAG: tRNA (adenine-N(6)-)-methyltransferase [Bacteroidota bacterium]